MGLRIDRSQVAVGSPPRALIIADHLDKTPAPFKLASERGFTTITGRYKGVPISIVSTGMGFPNTDFFVREVRECLSGDMLVVRSAISSASTSSAPNVFQPSLGSCGALVDIPPGSLVVPKACVGINRNWDYDFVNGDPTQQPYSITRQVRTRHRFGIFKADISVKVDADPEIYEAVIPAIKNPQYFLILSYVGLQVARGCPARGETHEDCEWHRECICGQVGYEVRDEHPQLICRPASIHPRADKRPSLIVMNT